MNSTPPYSSSPFDFYVTPDDEEQLLDDAEWIMECDDFWWDEEERHELF